LVLVFVELSSLPSPRVRVPDRILRGLDEHDECRSSKRNPSTSKDHARTMSENEITLVKEILSAFGSGAVTLIPLVLWLQTKFKALIENIKADFSKTFDSKIAALESALRLEIQGHATSLGDTREALGEIQVEIVELHKRKREHSDALAAVQRDIARLEGRIGIKPVNGEAHA